MIRHATLVDVPYIVELSKKFYPMTPYAKQGEFDEDTVEELTTTLIKRGIMLLAQDDESLELVGILGAIVAPFLYNKMVLGCNEAIWWVLPEYQKAGIGVQLLERADKLRKLRGCAFFQMMRVEGSSQALDTLFIKLGFQPSEYCFTKVN